MPAPAWLSAARLPDRWRGRARFVVLVSRFGDGNGALELWRMWRADPVRCGQLHLIVVDAELTQAGLLARRDDPGAAAHAAMLLAAWPPRTPNLHRLTFDGGAFDVLLLARVLADCAADLVAEVDAFHVASADVAAGTPQLQRTMKALGRIAAPGALVVVDRMTADVAAGMRAAGFIVEVPSPHEEHCGVARYAPAFTARRPAARRAHGTPRSQRAIVVGAGLAGCAATAALAERGWRVVLLERHADIAAEASGNPVGLFHGSVNATDGTHARFNRAAALEAAQAVRIAIDGHAVAGSIDGLLRLAHAPHDMAAMQAMLTALCLPSDYVQAVDAAEAGRLGGMPSRGAAWFYPGGGWVDPAGLARSYIERAGTLAEVRTGSDVHALVRSNDSWRLLDATGATIDEADTVVLANAGAALRLIGSPGWPIEKVRGQLSWARADDWPTGAAPRLPLVGAGYLLPSIDGRIVFGATSQPQDDDASVRVADHLVNLQRIGAAWCVPGVDPASLGGRTAWRWVAHDRLPVIGAVPEWRWLADPLADPPDAAAAGRDVVRDAAVAMPRPAPTLRLDQPRFVPRQPGLYLFTALGSRGITWSALGGRVLASMISGAPVGLEASLLDAIDPARFVSRWVRRASSAASARPIG